MGITVYKGVMCAREIENTEYFKCVLAVFGV